MSKMGDFIAFNAAVSLLKEQGKECVLTELYEQCKELHKNDQLHTVNVVKQIYKSFSNDEITKKIAELITPSNLGIPVDVIYQTIESLHEACPSNLGDWYFTGNYPTAGGNPVEVTKALALDIFDRAMTGRLRH